MQCQHQKRAGLLMNKHSNCVQYLCGKMKNAWRAFDKMPSHCVVYRGSGTCEMQAGSECRRQKFDKCSKRYEASLCHFHKGSEMSREWPHDLIIQTSCMSSVFVGSNFIDIYGKCGCIEDAGRAFHNNVVSRTAIINGHVDLVFQPLHYFDSMGSSLQDSCNSGTPHPPTQLTSLEMPRYCTGCDQDNILQTICGYMDGPAWYSQNSL
ncbi:unnamed protein product [Sphagnum tenellum]